MAVGAAIAAAIAAAATITTGVISYVQTEEASEEARELAEQQRQDQLRQFDIESGYRAAELRLRREEQESSEMFQTGQLRQKKRELAFYQQEAGYARAGAQYERIMGIINADQNLTNSLIAKLSRRPQGVGYGI